MFKFYEKISFKKQEKKKKKITNKHANMYFPKLIIIVYYDNYRIYRIFTIYIYH